MDALSIENNSGKNMLFFVEHLSDIVCAGPVTY